MKVSHLLREPRFSSKLEKDYVVIELESREALLARLYLQGVIVIVPALSVISYLIANPTLPNWQLWQLPFYHIVLAAFSAFTLATETRSRALRLRVLALFMLCQPSWITAVQSDLLPVKASLALCAAWYIVTILAAALMPFRTYVHHVLLAFMLGVFTFAFYERPYAVSHIASGLICWLIGSNVQILVHRFSKHSLISSFRDQSRYAPKQILMEAVRARKSITQVFPPADRHCIFLSSDWRSFQEFARCQPAQRVADKLGTYYDAVIAQLDSAFPHGNYFVDWIADELFVVFFADEHTATPALAGQVFTFAQWLLEFRKEFCSHHGAPHGIDIGLADGTAIVGVLGPQSQLKATALGESPGLARRLQTLAKHLRSIHGNCDRIVCSASLTALLNQYRHHTSAVVTDGVYAMRDLPAEEISVYPVFAELKSA